MKIPYDKQLHLIVCFLIALIVAVIMAQAPYKYVPEASPRFFIALASGLAAAMIAGFAKELHDRRSPGNRFDWADILWDAVGAVTGALLGAIVAYLV